MPDINLESQVMGVVKGQTIPDDWELRSVSVGYRKVYEKPSSMFVVLYDREELGDRKYSPEEFVHEAEFEHDAMKEHLTLMGRKDDADSISMIKSGDEKIAILVPHLGESAERKALEWYGQGIPTDSAPVTAEQFQDLYDALNKAEHINGDAGLYNLVVHPSKSPSFVDITSEKGKYENLNEMYMRLMETAAELAIPYDSLPDSFRDKVDAGEYSNLIRDTHAFALQSILENYPEINHTALSNLGIKKGYKLSNVSALLFIGQGESFIHLSLDTISGETYEEVYRKVSGIFPYNFRVLSHDDATFQLDKELTDEDLEQLVSGFEKLSGEKLELVEL